MSKEQQKKIIGDVIDYEKRTLLDLIDRGYIPDNWGEKELCHYLATQISPKRK